MISLEKGVNYSEMGQPIVVLNLYIHSPAIAPVASAVKGDVDPSSSDGKSQI